MATTEMNSNVMQAAFSRILRSGVTLTARTALLQRVRDVVASKRPAPLLCVVPTGLVAELDAMAVAARTPDAPPPAAVCSHPVISIETDCCTRCGVLYVESAEDAQVAALAQVVSIRPGASAREASRRRHHWLRRRTAA